MLVMRLPGGFDPPDVRLDDCATQRNLVLRRGDDGMHAVASRLYVE